MRRFWGAALSLFLVFRLSPPFTRTWAHALSRPMLNALAHIGMRVPCSLLEWGALCFAALLTACLFLHRLRKIVSVLTFCLFFGTLTLWYPLYALETPVQPAAEAQVYASCLNLIDELNASTEAFILPDDLPAKPALLSGWMRALDIGGLCAFLTGEALYAPDLEPVLLPFVAMHEYMHLEGYASEGGANIAAWESCMERGGAYAHSARLWALRYSMGLLQPAQRNELLSRMDLHTRRLYRSGGGAAISEPSNFIRSLQAFLGVENRMCNYENLAFHLAADFPQ